MPFDKVDLHYLDRLHAPTARVLKSMHEQGRRDGVPIVDPAVGRFLHVAIAARGARQVLEIGTAIGYSTAWMALALPPGGRITTIDPDQARTARAQRFWARLKVGRRVRVINAPALKVIPSLRGHFDACFIDAIKEEYGRYLAGVLPLLRPGAVIVVDNLLWSGRVARPTPGEATSTRALRVFNRRFLRHPRLRATILPVGDGIGFAVVR